MRADRCAADLESEPPAERAEGEWRREWMRSQQLGPAIIHTRGDGRAVPAGLGRQGTAGLVLNPPSSHYAPVSLGDEGDG